MSELSEAQERFSNMLPDLITEALRLTPHVRLGDLFRSPELHGELGVKKGYGHAFSCHKLKLAIDINLVVNGSLEGPEVMELHKILHDYWDSVGGAKRIDNDMNHYSLGWRTYR